MGDPEQAGRRGREVAIPSAAARAASGASGRSASVDSALGASRSSRELEHDAVFGLVAALAVDGDDLEQHVEHRGALAAPRRFDLGANEGDIGRVTVPRLAAKGERDTTATTVTRTLAAWAGG
jgi:hypothetical protein